MTALILLPQTFANGGIQRFNRTLLAACERLRMRCDILSLNDSEESAASWPVPENATLRVFEHDKLRFTAALARALWSGRHEVVLVGHINLLELTLSLLPLRGLNRPRTLLVTHGAEIWCGLGPLRRWALGCVDRILSVSEFTRSAIRTQAPWLDDDRIMVFPNALSDSWVASRTRLRESVDGNAWPDRFLLSVGRIDRRDRPKGVITTIEALGHVADRDLHYVVAGSGNDVEFLKIVAKRNSVAGRVHFPGAVSDETLADLYRRCSAFVLPSAQEGFGIVFLEAMYFGAPVIAAREKGALDVVRDNETGLLVRYGDPVELASAIQRLLGDDVLRARLRATALLSVVGDGRFTFRSFTARCADVFGVRVPDMHPSLGNVGHG